MFRKPLAFLFSPFTFFLSTFAFGQIIEKPPIFQVGDRWVYSGRNHLTSTNYTFSHTVHSVAETVVLLTERNSGSSLDEIDLSGNFLLRPRGRYEGDKTLKFPMNPYSTWENNFSWTGGHGNGVTKSTASTSAWQTITTKAGTFQVIKIENNGRYTNHTFSCSNRTKWTRWYSPNVKFPIKSSWEIYDCQGNLQSEGEEELVSYSLK